MKFGLVLKMDKGEIYLVELPYSNGHEQAGFRPAVVFSKTIKNTIILIPLTTNLNYSNFECTLKISNSKKNGLKSDSVALAYQVKVIDVTRLKSKIGVLEDEYLNKLNLLLKELLKI